MKKTIQILLMILIVTLLMPVFAGCSSNARETNALFSCNSDNFIGLKDISLSDDGQMTIFLDKKNSTKGDFPYGLFKDLFKEGKYPEDRLICISFKDGTNIKVPAEEIKIDSLERTISFRFENNDSKEIQSIRIYPAMYSNCEIMIDSGEIFTEAYGGECTMIYSQKYSSESGSWSEINCNTILYPMTDG